MNIATLRNTVYSWAHSVSNGAPIVWADQSAPRPPKPYVTLKLNGPYRDHHDDLRATNQHGVYQTTGPRRFMLYVQVFGTGENVTHQLAERMNFSLGTETIRAFFRLYNVAIAREGSIENVTAFLDTTWEPRFSFDVELMTTATGQDNLDTIEYVEIEYVTTEGV